MDDIQRKVEEIYEETPNWVVWLTIAIGVLTVVGYLISSLCCGTSSSLSISLDTRRRRRQTHRSDAGKKKFTPGRTLLLLGSNGAGKTTLMYKMCFNATVPTHTSIKPLAVSTRNLSEKEFAIDVIDVPGHPRLRQQALKKYSPSVGGIVFVLDAVNTNVRDSAEFLYDVLTDPIIDERVPPILLFCNKSDCKNAKSRKIIRKQLETELSKLKETRMSLNATGSSKENEDAPLMLGLQDVDFKFDEHSPCAVSFEVGSAMKGKIDPILDFVQDAIE